MIREASTRVMNLVGQRFGRLVVKGYAGRNRRGRTLWECQCDCGRATTTTAARLRAGNAKSCGCFRRDQLRERYQINGQWNTGRRYLINRGERTYKTKCAWSKAAIKHYGNGCEICGWREARCDVHHRVPRSKGGKNTIANAIVLCPNHHRLEHKRRADKSVAIEEAVSASFHDLRVAA